MDSALLPTEVITQWVAAFLWPLFRVSTFIMLAPVFGSSLVVARARIMLSILITLVLLPHLPPVPAMDLLSLRAVQVVAQQVLLGAALAFSMQLFFQVFIMAGQVIALKIGLGFATMVDPSTQGNTTVIGQFYLLIITLLMLVTDGHLAMLEVLAGSFHTFPVGEVLPGSDVWWALVSAGSWVFAGGLLLAMPIVVSLLIINGAMGIVTRSAPQLNIFAIGFPFTLLVGLGAMLLGMGTLLPSFTHWAEVGLALMQQISEGG